MIKIEKRSIIKRLFKEIILKICTNLDKTSLLRTKIRINLIVKTLLNEIENQESN